MSRRSVAAPPAFETEPAREAIEERHQSRSSSSRSSLRSGDLVFDAERAATTSRRIRSSRSARRRMRLSRSMRAGVSTARKQGQGRAEFSIVAHYHALDHLGGSAARRPAPRLQSAFVVQVGASGQGFGTCSQRVVLIPASSSMSVRFCPSAGYKSATSRIARAYVRLVELPRQLTEFDVARSADFGDPALHHRVSIHLRRAAGVIVRVAHDRLACTEVCGIRGERMNDDTSTSSTERSSRVR